jgi:D-glycero-alpha-D-manno-heptose 1-phosphate guanylyltransferase
MTNSLSSIDVLILCGGLGTRLSRVIPDRPKGLAPVGGKPFLDILVDDLLQQGFQRTIFCVGHLKEQIIERYQSHKDAEFLFSQEDMPLGTGGAILNALPLIRSHLVLIINGDSICPVNFAEFHEFHLDKLASVSLVLARPEGRHDAGEVSLNDAQQIESFIEKSKSIASECFINAGIYLIKRDVIELQALAPPFSLEYDVLPELVRTKPCFGFVVKSRLVDIGTPERYLKANSENNS